MIRLPQFFNKAKQLFNRTKQSTVDQKKICAWIYQKLPAITFSRAAVQRRSRLFEILKPNRNHCQSQQNGTEELRTIQTKPNCPVGHLVLDFRSIWMWCCGVNEAADRSGEGWGVWRNSVSRLWSGLWRGHECGASDQGLMGTVLLRTAWIVLFRIS